MQAVTADSAKQFSRVPPIVDADPSVRHEQVFQVPARLVIDDWPGVVSVRFDSRSARHVTITVGEKMIVGVKWGLYYYDGMARVALMENMIGTVNVLDEARAQTFTGVNSVAARYGTVQLLAEIILFETDVPHQHMWHTYVKSDNYRELWKGLATGQLMVRR